LRSNAAKTIHVDRWLNIGRARTQSEVWEFTWAPVRSPGGVIIPGLEVLAWLNLHPELNTLPGDQDRRHLLKH
jgi:hypothetical protein